MNDEDYKNTIPVGTIPKNYSILKQAVGSMVLNVAEGIAITGVFAFFVNLIPFVKILKLSLIVICFIIVLALEIKGYHDYTLLTALYYYIKWKRNSKKYTLGTVEDRPPVKASTNFSDIKKSILKKLNVEEIREMAKTYENKAKEKFNGNGKH